MLFRFSISAPIRRFIKFIAPSIRDSCSLVMDGSSDSCTSRRNFSEKNSRVMCINFSSSLISVEFDLHKFLHAASSALIILLSLFFFMMASYQSIYNMSSLIFVCVRNKCEPTTMPTFNQPIYVHTEFLFSV